MVGLGRFRVVAGVILAVAAPAAISVDTVTVAVFAGMVPWLVGLAWRQATALVRAGWDRLEQLEREQRLVAEQARHRERARIAQDMHDVLGHELNLIALRAGALKLAPGLDDRYRGAAGELRSSAAAAVERLGEVVGVLRESADDSSTTPAGASVSALVERAAAAGIDVDLTIDGAPPTAGVMHDRAVHRVVREALTNVAKLSQPVRRPRRPRPLGKSARKRHPSPPSPPDRPSRQGPAAHRRPATRECQTRYRHASYNCHGGRT